MSNNKKVFTIKYYNDFYNIPNDTEILIFNIKLYQEQSDILLNLPVLLEEIHFNTKFYIFDDTSSNYNTIYPSNFGTYSFSLHPYEMKYNIKIPFGCKIFKFNINENKSEEILNFNETIIVKYECVVAGTENITSFR